MHNIMLNCEEEKNFNILDGGRIRNLVELHKSLDEMDQNVFNHHVNDERNDFSNWVHDVLKDKKLAKEIAGTRELNVMQLMVKKRLVGHFVKNFFYDKK